MKVVRFPQHLPLELDRRHPHVGIGPLGLNEVFFDPTSVILLPLAATSVLNRKFVLVVVTLHYRPMHICVQDRVRQRPLHQYAHVPRTYCRKVLPVAPGDVLGLDGFGHGLAEFALGQKLDGRLGLGRYGLANSRQRR